jgi:hypothetical protein
MTSTAVDRAPSVWEDLLEILYAPSAVFARRKETVAFGLALVILTVLTAVVFFATKSGFEPVLDAMVKQQSAEVLRQNPQMTPEQLSGAAGMMRGGTIATMLVYPVLGSLLIGLLLWAVGKLFNSKAGIGAAMMVATYGYVPRFVGFVVSSILAVLLPEDRITSFFSISVSLAQFLDPATTSMGVLGSAARFDVFLVWQTIVCGIGMSVLGGISRGRGLAVAFTVWALGFVLLIPALLS